MKITTIRTTKCGDDVDCPSLHRTDDRPDGVYVVAKRVEDPQVHAGFAHLVSPDEILGFVPNELLRDDDGFDWPSLHRTDDRPDGMYVVAKRVDDPHVLTEFARLVGPDEILGFLPNQLLLEV